MNTESDWQRKLLYSYKAEKEVVKKMTVKNKVAYKARIGVEEILERKAFEAEFDLL